VYKHNKNGLYAAKATYRPFYFSVLCVQNSGNFDFMGWGAVFMLESFPVLLAIGSVLGFLAGLGVGGGSLLMLWLTLVIGTDHSVARNINLLFFIP